LDADPSATREAETSCPALASSVATWITGSSGLSQGWISSSSGAAATVVGGITIGGGMGIGGCAATGGGGMGIGGCAATGGGGMGTGGCAATGGGMGSGCWTAAAGGSALGAVTVNEMPSGTLNGWAGGAGTG
jgi:hypothetical protein